MAATTLFKKTPVRGTPKANHSSESLDFRYWKAFGFPVTKKEYGPIKDISFSQVEPYTYAVSSASRIYSCETNEIEKTFSKFKEDVHCARFRQDGALVVAGTEIGMAKVYDVERKLCLRLFRGHSSAVHAAEFLQNEHQILTCSDDRSAIVWDLTTGDQLHNFRDCHEDHIRSCALHERSKSIFLTGSYDGTAKLFDLRSNSVVQTVDHKAPIEDVAMFKSGSVFLTAGGDSVKLWDSLAGGKLLMELVSHHKTVTCLKITPDGTRLLTGGLDRNVKVYDTKSLKVVHTLNYPAPVISLGMSCDEGCLAVGMADGMLSVRKRRSAAKWKKTKRPPRRDYTAGAVEPDVFDPAEGAHVVEEKRRQNLAKYDRLLKSFEYSKALDYVLETKLRMGRPEVTVALIEELIRRDGIKAAMAGRDEKSLDIIIRFISRHITNPQYMKTMADVLNVLLDLYEEHSDRMSGVLPRLVGLSSVVNNEIKYEEQLMQLLGTMDAIMSMSNTSDRDVPVRKPTEMLDVVDADS